MLLRFSCLLTICIPLFAAFHLQKQYYFTNTPIYSTTLFPEIEKKFILFNISDRRTQYRVKSSVIAKRFKEHGFPVDAGNVRYVNFIKKSPISTLELEQQLQVRYSNFFAHLHVKNIQVTPRSYLASLPQEYRLLFPKKNLYHARGIFSIETAKKKRLYFNYRLHATIDVYTVRHSLKRGDPLTPINTVRKELPFEHLRAKPLEDIPAKTYRLRRSIKPDHIITHRDIERYPMVAKGSSVIVELKSGSVTLQFSAKASQDGAKNDMITVQKQDGHRIKARVIAAGRVEIE